MKNYSLIILPFIILGSCQNPKKEQLYHTISYGYDYSQLRPELLDSFLILEELYCIPQYKTQRGYSQTFRTYWWFISTINIQEAKSLYYHRNDFVKAMGVEGIYRNRDPIFGKLFIESFENDSMYICKRSGCIESTLYPQDIFLNCFANPNGFYSDTIVMTKEEKIILDSLIMNSSDSSYFSEYRPKEFQSRGM